MSEDKGNKDLLEEVNQSGRDALSSVSDTARSFFFGSPEPSLQEREVAALEQIAENGKKK